MKVLLMCWMMVLGACVEESPVETIRMAEAELGKSDAQTRLIGRDLKLGVKGDIEVLSEGGWVIRGRSNVELQDLTARIAGRDQRVEVLSTEFQIHLDDLAYQDLMVETPLTLEAVGPDESAALTVSYAPRWIDTRGSRKLKIEREAYAVVLPGGATAVRALAQTNEGFSLESVFTDDDLEPEITRDFDWKWQVQWSTAQAVLLSDFQDDRVFFATVDSDDTRYQTTSKLRLRAVEQVWTADPPMFAVRNCNTSTRFCMQHLNANAPDASECGTVQEVLACFRFDASR